MTASSRRNFLRSTGAAATAALFCPAQTIAADRTLRLGVIGLGWYGMVDARAALKAGGVEVAAVCDVDSQHLDRSADERP
jgi:hypothetical protein